MLPVDTDAGALALLLVAAFAAGWIDAVVGGGGLLQLPALLLVPGITPVQALATNKLASVFGTATSSVAYARRVRPSPRTVLPMAGIALLGAFGGASLAAFLPAQVFTPIILVALLVVGLITLLKPTLGEATRPRHRGLAQLAVSGAIGAFIGFYDGLLGPGTGTFLVISLVGLLGYDFLRATATAKLVNFATNLGALLFFIPLGAVLWPLGLAMGAASIVGSLLGSRMAIARGSRFVRVLFLAVVGVLTVKLGLDVWAEAVR
ncbi:sulfite exporter TauE/SafE family protein [Leucobacter chromiireducens subsp. chromiireducens]|uniref:Probable membrane transporter protein n=1 Tax=Leucobacter chromiireducens subsp. chromiireducens TaxID=660067 RepID=A0ABS1SPK9_9MICO|nr:TSUP family transporter [Leucobacter chromiireducens]MBL3690105.1 sulfite exporter TauE/SafE family protein [Leucobacter chromiireducens subsp. chromiireducens]